MERDEWAERRGPLLDRVHARGQELRRRRQTTLGFVAVAVLLLIAVPALALTGGGDGHRKVNTVGSPTTSVETVPETVAVPEATTTTETPTTTLPPTTTTTVLVCRNSYNPKCGPFRYDPPPVSHPITVSITFSPPNPTTGEKVTIHVVADNPDTHLGSYTISYGGDRDGQGSAVDVLCDSAPARQRYGPWDPPAKNPGHEEFDFENTYSQAGSYPVTFTISTAPGCGDDVYHSDGKADATMTVTGPPVTTTTTTTTPH